MRVSLAVAAALVVTALAAPAAGATIVPQRAIAGIALHMTKAQVRAHLGAPARIRAGKNDFGRYTTFVYPRVSVSFQSGPRVTALRTTSPKEKTAKGVGVGSTEAQVKARVAHVVCSSELGARQCFVGRFLPGRKVTAFAIKRGRVTSVVIGIVLD